MASEVRISSGFHGGVAQGLEQAAHIRCVGGSNPSTARHYETHQMNQPEAQPS